MNHIKVYKTNIDERPEADSIRNDIMNHFENYVVSLDLNDCDKVLRVESLNGPVDDATVQTIVSARGHYIERLPLH
ncbi:MAG: hypothetical protein FH748_06940 [Balneolaceae bacterium]|nr:hypothetical protein [Balneolaceae bacterium]